MEVSLGGGAAGLAPVFWVWTPGTVVGGSPTGYPRVQLRGCTGAAACACGCAGVFNAQTAMSCYAQVFDEHECLERLAGFSSHFGADFYGLPRNTEQLTLRKGPALNTPPDVEIDAHRIRHFLPDEPVHWHISDPSG